VSGSELSSGPRFPPPPECVNSDISVRWLVDWFEKLVSEIAKFRQWMVVQVQDAVGKPRGSPEMLIIDEASRDSAVVTLDVSQPMLRRAKPIH
jgi:hypothetical protein